MVMKFNLKNRPFLEGESTWNKFIEYHGKNEEWFEGREKELKEEIRYLKSMEPEELYEYIHSKKFEKQILGDK